MRNSPSIIIALLTIGLSSAQPPDRPAFAVTSVKPTDLSSNPRIDIRALPDGGLTATNVTLKFLIRVAYQVQDIQISGGPSWIETEKYDLLGKPAENAKPQFLAMLQSLLEDRFKLTVHRESQERPVYELHLAKSGGKFGPNLHELEPGACPPGPPASGTERSTPCSGFLNARNRVTGHRVPLSALATNLSGIVHLPVVDKTDVGTGATKQFDLDLFWTPDPGLAGPGDTVPIPDANAPSFFTALQEQLGLKLDAAKGQVEMLVIDHIERPSPN